LFHEFLWNLTPDVCIRPGTAAAAPDLSAEGLKVEAKAGHGTMKAKRLCRKRCYYELDVQPKEEAKRLALGYRSL